MSGGALVVFVHVVQDVVGDFLHIQLVQALVPMVAALGYVVIEQAAQGQNHGEDEQDHRAARGGPEG